MKIIFMLSFLFTIMFMFTKHPLSMGSILLIQTIMSCILCGYNMYSYLFSYILYLIFIGGMMVLFMYMATIASNEKFYMMNWLLVMIILLTSCMLLFNKKLFIELDLINKMMKLLDLYNSLALNKLYLVPTGMLTLMMVILLFFTLIVVSNIMGIKFAPLRSFY
uniref:NADH-ubiquinone oxidoreductase chain 6 n=1 Tax=Platypedia putnami TaxID=324535 RepID=A0A3Q8GR68_9HEMI|nr:NADH dehydrogenase subunit 6 [Platypedia putnami]